VVLRVALFMTLPSKRTNVAGSRLFGV